MQWIVPALDHGGPQRIRTYQSISDQNEHSAECPRSAHLALRGPCLMGRGRSPCTSQSLCRVLEETQAPSLMEGYVRT